MAEWLKAHAWKVCIRETVSGVRIPLSPPITLLTNIIYLLEIAALIGIAIQSRFSLFVNFAHILLAFLLAMPSLLTNTLLTGWR